MRAVILRPAPEVAKLLAARAGWRRLLRTLWCAVLLIFGQLAVVQQADRPEYPSVSLRIPFQCVLSTADVVLLHGGRAPPLLA